MLKAIQITRRETLTRDLAAILFGSLIIALSGPFSIKLPFTPVPIVLQNSMPILAGLLLGPRRAFLATLLFLSYGLSGLPVFANGASGLSVFFGPTCGYLLGYLASSYVAGLFAEKGRNNLAIMFGSATCFIFGVPFLSLFIGLKSAILLGFFPFILGDFMKNMALASFARSPLFRNLRSVVR